MIFLATLLIAGMLMSGEVWMLRMMWRAATLPIAVAMWPFYGLARESTAAEDETVDEQADQADADPGDPLSLVDVETPGDEAAIEAESAEAAEFKVNPPVAPMTAGDAVRAELAARARESVDAEFEFPDLDLLEDSEEFPFELLAKKAQHTAAILERTFEEFGLNVKVSEVDTGPVVTQFELKLEPGLRVSKVANLADDLAIALRVPAVRVVSPIPGKNTVGVEVPNDKRVMVRLRELIEACDVPAEKMRIPIFLGKDVSGHPLTVDLAKLPHLLIAGRTGTGKSVCLNTLILSMLMSRSPDDVRMLMIDPKMVELSPYMRIPHLMHPVITDMKKAEAVLAWAVEKMEERYDPARPDRRPPP